MCIWLLKCSCAFMFTSFVNQMLTCVLALKIICLQVYLLWWSHASMFTHFNVHLLWCSHTSMSTCFDYHILLSLYTLTITCPLGYMPWCSYARTLLWLYALMFTSFVDHLLLCSLSMMIKCFPVYMLWWSHAHFLVCLQAHMLGHFDDYLLLYWNELIIACSYALIFTCLISTHMCTHFNDEMSIGSKAKVIV